MANTINAITTGIGGLATTADSSGDINLQSAGSTVVAVTSSGVAVTGTMTVGGNTVFNAGTVSAPAITTTGDTNTGIFFPAADTIAFAEGGAEVMRILSTGTVVIGNGETSATPSAGVLEATDGSGTNITGASLTLQGGRGTGTGPGGALLFQTSPAGSTGSSLNAAVERMRITSTGGLALGTTSDPGTGAINATGNITAFFSDARLKDFKGTIPNALDKVQALNGYYFTENEKAKELGYNNNKVQVGVSAQEVEAVLPEIVTEAPISAEYKTVYYDKLVPLLIEAIKELSEKVKVLENKLGVTI